MWQQMKQEYRNELLEE